MTLQPVYIAGSSIGLVTDRKPFLLPDQAFTELNNAYVWRERVKKREGLEFLGRLRRLYTLASLGNSGASPWTFNIYSTLVPPIVPETNATIEVGNVTINIGVISFSDFVKSGAITAATQANPCQITSANHRLTTGDEITIAAVGGMTELNGNTYIITVVDANNFTLDGIDSTNFTAYTAGGTWSASNAQGNGYLVSPTAGNSGIINYLTGDVTLTHTAGAGVATTITFGYFPALPVMGIWQREIPGLNQEDTIFFDTTYAYINPGTGFQEWIPGTTWSGGDADFFWATNYRGSADNDRLFFVTNFVSNAGNPMRYANPAGTVWTSFTPLITATDTLFQARILIPYYGRLLALNTYEGTTAGGAALATNFFNRCRFSQIGSPIAVDAWRSDLFGKGGFIDAPTNEAIISATFFKNTLIVGFETSTWQLRYVGEYGLPFLWERISSDFGTESTFSPILFDQGVASVGDRAITSATANNVQRIDEQIPDTVFSFRNEDNGLERIIGIRDFRRELAYWCYSQADTGKKFPTSTLLYNYRNNTFANFRNNVTFFGIFQPQTNVTWDSQVVTWDSDVTWDDVEDEAGFERIVVGNQQGYVHYYGYTTFDDPSLSISAVDLTVSPNRLKIVNHNLIEGDIIYLTDLAYDAPPTNTLNNQFFYVVDDDDADHIHIMQWDFVAQAYVNTPIQAAPPNYIGAGQAALIPRLSAVTKDFNPIQDSTKQFKLSYIDFLMDNNDNDMSVSLYVNSSLNSQANIITGNQTVNTSATAPYQDSSSEYVWQRFFATTVGQFCRIEVTYDDNLMNTLATHENEWVMNAICLWIRPGGKNVIQ